MPRGPHSLEIAASWIPRSRALFAAAAFGGLAFLLEGMGVRQTL